MLSIQRSIPIPRIGLEKLINYILLVGENPGINCSVIKEKRLDIGKGKGDITRFFQRIGLIEVDEKCGVRLTEVGNAVFKALNEDLTLAKMLLHLVLYRELPHYRLLIDLISEHEPVGVTELHELANRRIRELSPTAWLNDVAYKALIGLAIDLEVIEVTNNKVNIRYTASVSECIRKSIAITNNQKILRMDNLNNCLKQLIRNFDIKASLINNLNNCVEPIVAPGPIGSRNTYFRVIDEDCVVRQVVDAILRLPIST
ncbi:hypothetical protein [Vulcanisaeta souniana]|uniref:Uncharacterized protein n=1 Tax=Vulcanisaeta souniana JCM 11219 TaxID=1293586 RepID=A0A830EI48_9CREN|nr:hypothetical protein [Vulcanisaeta souniana]BDR91261.1 hypothetical protein Vsou_03540 [Vulcanisaeta souniana JCM 11219]GGI85004.1 hypothetical protein GCM10007112_22500 [Vulcanisaeta souniana JCM 11219]